MEEKSNNLKLENDEPPISPSSVKTSKYIHCDENEDEKQLSWTPYYSPDEELKNNLRNVLLSDIDTSGKIELILALCRPTMVQIPEIISLKETT